MRKEEPKLDLVDIVAISCGSTVVAIGLILIILHDFGIITLGR